MNDGADRTRNALAAYRGATTMEASVKDALWARVERSVEAGETGPVLDDLPPTVVVLDRWRTAGRIAVALAGAAAVLLLIRAVDWRSLSGDRRSEAPHEQAVYGVADREADDRAAHTRVDDRRQAPAAKPVIEDDPPAEQPGVAPVEQDAGQVAPTDSKSSGARAQVVARPPTPTVQAPPADSLAEEMRLMSRARTALAEQRPDAALQALKTHEASFPSGQMSEDRAALRARSLCAAANNEDAARAAREFLAAHAGSAHRATVAAVLARASDKKCGPSDG